jgi:hypothetical protein
MNEPKKEIKYWNGVGCPKIGELFIDSAVEVEDGIHPKPFLCYSLGEDFAGGLAFEALWYVGEVGCYTEEFCFNSYVKTSNYLNRLQVANETHLSKRVQY